MKDLKATHKNFVALLQSQHTTAVADIQRAHAAVSAREAAKLAAAHQGLGDLREEHTEQTTKLAALVESSASAPAAAAAASVELGRLRPEVRRLREVALSQLSELQRHKPSRVEVEKREAEGLLRAANLALISARGDVQRATAELATAKLVRGLGPLDEAAGPHMLRTVLEKNRKGGMVEVVRPKPALKARLSALRSCAKFLFGLGWVWALAFLISSHGQGAMHVLSFKRPRETVQKLLQRDMKVLEKSDKNIKIAFLTRLLTIIGRKRWDKQRRALKYTASLAPSAGKRARVTFTQRMLRVGMFTLVQFDDMCSRSDHEKARNLLVDKYSKVREADFRITKLHDEDGFEVGAMACPYGVAIACVKSSIEHQAYHEHTKFVVRYESDGSPYLYTVVGDGCDEYPRNRKNTATEGSLSNRLEYGAACSPERQFPYLSVDSKETGFATGIALRKKDAAVRKLHSSLNPGERITLDVILPENPDPIFRAFVTDPSAELAGRPISIPAAVDYMPLFDLKHHSYCYGNGGQSAIYGGVGYSVDKDHLCLPEARLMPRSEYMEDEERNEQDNYFLHDDAYISSCVDDVCDYMAKHRENNPDASTEKLAEHAKEYCKSKKHSWWKERKPFSYMQLVFFCVLHLDTNLCAAWLELYEAYTLQLAGARGLSYDDPKSPHRRFHDAMDTADMGPLTDRLRNRIPPQKDPQDFRCLGPHAISSFNHIHLFDAACEVEDETEAEWLERNTMKTMALMHRGISALHSQFTLEKSSVLRLVEMGRMMMRLVKELHLPRSYNLNYMCIGNPQLLEMHMGRFVLGR